MSNLINSIDLLIGAEFFFELLESDKIELYKNKLFLQNSKLCWVVAGLIPKSEDDEINSSQATNVLHCSLNKNDSLDETLKQFWEIENVTDSCKTAWSAEETMCEKIYTNTTRDEQGRFIVSLPIKTENVDISEIRSTALKRLNQIERQFKQDLS